MKRPKVGELWLVDSGYSWGWCVVEIVDNRYAEYVDGIVISGEDTLREDEDGNMSEGDWNDEAHNGCVGCGYDWSFLSKHLVRKLEGV